MSVINPELNIPDDGGGAAPCTGQSKGFVVIVDKCRNHDHYIDLHSLGTYVLTVDTDSTVTVNGDSYTTVFGNSDVIVNGQLRITPNGDMYIEGDGNVMIDKLHIKWKGGYESIKSILDGLDARISGLGG